MIGIFIIITLKGDYHDDQTIGLSMIIKWDIDDDGQTVYPTIMIIKPENGCFEFSSANLDKMTFRGFVLILGNSNSVQFSIAVNFNS